MVLYLTRPMSLKVNMFVFSSNINFFLTTFSENLREETDGKSAKTAFLCAWFGMV